MDSRHSSAAGTQRYDDASMVPVNSKFVSKSDFCASEGGRGVFGAGDRVGEGRGMKPWEVGRELRIRAWLREGTWKIAQARGTWSHLFFFLLLLVFFFRFR